MSKFKRGDVCVIVGTRNTPYSLPIGALVVVQDQFPDGEYNVGYGPSGAHNVSALESQLKLWTPLCPTCGAKQ